MVPAAYGSEPISLAGPAPLSREQQLEQEWSSMAQGQGSPGEPPKLVRQVSYSVFGREDLMQRQRAMIFRVAERLQVSTSSAATLLLNCRWKEEECLEAFRSPSTREDLLRRSNIRTCLAGSFLTAANGPSEAPAKSGDQGGDVDKAEDDAEEEEEEEEITCQVCYDDLPPAETFGMRCGHRLCLVCYREFLENEVMGGTAGGSNCLRSVCPAFKCNESVGEEVFEMLLPAEMFDRYRQMQFQSFVDDADEFCWCPKPGCLNVIGFTTRCKTVRCECDHVFW